MSRRILPFLALFPLALLLGSCAGVSQQPGMSARPSGVYRMPPREAEELWRRAEQEEKAGNASSAISLWERIAQTYANNMIAAKALDKAGAKYLEMGQAERALRFFDYLLYNYPDWEGVSLARLHRLRALSAVNRKKEVMKEAVPLWEASAAQSDVRVPLALLMARIYEEERDLKTAFEWISAGFSSAKSPDQTKSLSNAMIELLKNADEATVKKLESKKLPEFIKAYLEHRLAQIDMQKGRKDAARERLRLVLNRNPSHPLASEIKSSLEGAGPGKPTAPPAPSAPPPVAGVPVPRPASAFPLHKDRIGCLLPLNGSYATYGQMVLRGLNMAIGDWNDKYPGEQISLVVKDIQTDPESAKNAFQELLKDEGVIGIIGPLGAQTTKAVAPLADEWGVPLLALTQKEDDTPNNSYVVHVFLDNRELVAALVRYCRQKLGYTRFAALYPDDRYGQNLSKIFAEAVQAQGGSLLASVSYRDKSTDFKESIQKLMKLAKENVPPSGLDTTPFEALFIPDQVQTVALIAPQLPYNNVVGATLLGTNLWGEGAFVQAGGAYVDQAIMSTPFFAEGKSQQICAFREKYQREFGASPSYLEAQAYDAMMLFLNARSGLNPSTMDRASLLQNLHRIRGFRGIAGTYSFSADSRMSRDYLIIQVSNGELVQVSP
jgi:branched-chain amino acid transport system substrate-binding protein